MEIFKHFYFMFSLCCWSVAIISTINLIITIKERIQRRCQKKKKKIICRHGWNSCRVQECRHIRNSV